MKKVLIAIIFAFSALAFGADKTLVDIKTADCTGVGSDAFVKIDSDKKSISGQIEGLSLMTNAQEESEFMFLELLTDWPIEGYNGYGSLVYDEEFYWGSMTLVSKAGEALNNDSQLKVYFVDQLGQNRQADVKCQLTFN